MLKSRIPKCFQIPGCRGILALCSCNNVQPQGVVHYVLLPDVNGAVKRVNWRFVAALYCYSQAWHGFYWCFALSIPDNQLSNPPTMKTDWENSIKLVQGKLAVKFPSYILPDKKLCSVQEDAGNQEDSFLTVVCKLMPVLFAVLCKSFPVCVSFVCCFKPACANECQGCLLFYASVCKCLLYVEYNVP